MRGYYCDRCGKAYKARPAGSVVLCAGIAVDDTTDYKAGYEALDLCERCQGELENWVRKRPLRHKARPELDPAINGGFDFGEV